MMGFGRAPDQNAAVQASSDASSQEFLEEIYGSSVFGLPQPEQGALSKFRISITAGNPDQRRNSLVIGPLSQRENRLLPHFAAASTI
jgi:hypothetical protein